MARRAALTAHLDSQDSGLTIESDDVDAVEEILSFPVAAWHAQPHLDLLSVPT